MCGKEIKKGKTRRYAMRMGKTSRCVIKQGKTWRCVKRQGKKEWYVIMVHIHGQQVAMNNINKGQIDPKVDYPYSLNPPPV